MAKAGEIRVRPGEPFRFAGGRIVRARADELFDAADGVLDTRDIERVHDMRVASRRLRAVLEIFAPCFPPARVQERAARRQAARRRARRAPRPRRAHRRAGDFARAVVPAQRPGVRRLVAEQRARQAAGNEILAAELARAAERGLHGRLHAIADAAEEPAA